jgi:hypothetical protein
MKTTHVNFHLYERLNVNITYVYICIHGKRNKTKDSFSNIGDIEALLVRKTKKIDFKANLEQSNKNNSNLPSYLKNHLMNATLTEDLDQVASCRNISSASENSSKKNEIENFSNIDIRQWRLSLC